MMTDRDVVERLARLWGANALGPYLKEGRRPVFAVAIHTRRAVGWMMTLYALMGERRRARIREILAAWRSYERLDNEDMRAARAASMTPEVRARIAESNRGQKRTAEQRARMSEAKRAAWARRKQG